MTRAIRTISPVALVLLFAAVVLVWTSSNMKWGGGRWNSIVKTDGTGYFSYLPAVFVYQDPEFGFFDSIASVPEHNQFAYDYRRTWNGHTVNKYFAGTALMLSPWYMLGQTLNHITGQSLDGFSVWVLIMVQVAAIFYVLLGMYWLALALRTWQISNHLRAWTLFFVLFGTNLFYYVSEEPAMSHTYSFALASLFVLAVRRVVRDNQLRWFVVAALAFGGIVLIRPVNGLMLFSLPFLSEGWGGLSTTLRKLSRRPVILWTGILAALLVIMVQPLIWYVQTGTLWVDSYPGEGFHFQHWNVGKFLFSYRKGLFVYTPVTLIALAGLWPMYRQKPGTALWWLAFMFVSIRIISSWWMWYYGGSFSSRVMIEYLPFFMIALALWLQWLHRWRKAALLLLLLLTLLCQAQTYQYRYGYLHWDSMTKELYWERFLDFGFTQQRDQ